MKELPAWLRDLLIKRYQLSSYAKFLEMEIIDLFEGEATISMLVRRELTNLSGMLHGGAVGSLLDMAMNLACFTSGKEVRIIGFNINFLHGAKEGETVQATAKILHRGGRTMVVESKLVDPEKKLLAKGRGTFTVIGNFKPETQEDIESTKSTDKFS